MILAKLGPYEKLSATLAAHKSVGMEHAKWQPAVVSMNYDGGEDEAPGLAPADFDFEVEAVGHMGPAPLVRRALAALEQKLFFVGDRFRKLSEFGENWVNAFIFPAPKWLIFYVLIAL